MVNLPKKSQEKIDLMKGGVNQVERVAMEIFKATRGWATGVPRLGGP